MEIIKHSKKKIAMKLEERDPFRIVFMIFKYYGLWSFNSRRHRFISIVAFLLLLIVGSVLIMISLQNAKTVTEMTKSTLYLSIFSMGFACAANIYRKRKEFEDIFDDFGTLINENDAVRPFIEKGLQLGRRIFWIFTGITSVVIVTSLIIGPIIFGKNEIPMWFLSEHFFYVTWLLQFASGFYAISLSLFSIELTCNLLITLHSYIEYFQHRLSTIKSGDENDLIACVKIHWNIQRLASKLEKVIAIPCAAVGLFGISVLCTMAFHVSKRSILESKNFAVFIPYIFRMIALTAQMFRACYFSQKIQTSSEKFIETLFASNWIPTDRKYKKMMLIFNENLKKPITLKIFNTFRLNLETFQSILNLVYSLYTLLNNLNH